jgi:hypothetical protein
LFFVVFFIVICVASFVAHGEDRLFFLHEFK